MIFSKSKRTIALVKRIGNQNVLFFYVIPKRTFNRVIGLPIYMEVKMLFQNVLKCDFKNFN